MIEHAGLNIHDSTVVSYVVHSSCNYLSEISYPGIIEVGIVVKKLGNSSATYKIGIFKDGENKVSAYGEFVHVFVTRPEKKPVPIPKNILESLNELLIK